MYNELYTASVKAMLWDETISMSIAQDLFPTSTPTFYQVIKPATAFLLEHTGEDLRRDLEQFLATSSRPITIETSFPNKVPVDIMQDLGFEYSPGQTIRLMELTESERVSPVPSGVTIQRITSLDDQETWEKRIQVEAELFQYPPTGYIDRLRVGLAAMFENDTHFLAFDGSTVIGYMTMRYTRGIAYLQGAGVLEPYRRRGITRHLLDLAKQDAISKNYHTMTTTGWNDAAEATWTSLGFTILDNKVKNNQLLLGKSTRWKEWHLKPVRKSGGAPGWVRMAEVLDLKAIHGEDVLSSEITFTSGRDAKYFIQDYCFNKNKSMRLRVGKKSGNSKTFVCTCPTCEWKVIATKCKRKNEEEHFYFSTIHDVHSEGCTSTRKASERQLSLLTYNPREHSILLPTATKKPRRENVVEMIVKTLAEDGIEYRKMSVKAIQAYFQQKHGLPVSAHNVTRAKEILKSSMFVKDDQAMAGQGMEPPILQMQHLQYPDIQLLVGKNKQVAQLLMDAVQHGDISALRTLLHSTKVDLEAIDSFGCTALIIATATKLLNVVNCLLDFGAKTEAMNPQGLTPLWIAVQMDQLHIAKCLLDHRANIEATDEHSRTPLLFAAQQGNLKMVKFLIKRKANIEASDDDDNTALLLAIQYQHRDVIDFLIKKGANTAVRNIDGMAAIGLANAGASLEIVHLVAHPSPVTSSVTEPAQLLVPLEVFWVLLDGVTTPCYASTKLSVASYCFPHSMLSREQGLLLAIVGASTLLPVFACVAAKFVDGCKSSTETTALKKNHDSRLRWQGQRISTRVSTYFYLSHFLTSWCDRMWQYALPLLAAQLFPSTLLPVVLFPLSTYSILIVAMPLLGKFVDCTDRWTVIRTGVISLLMTLLLSNASLVVLVRTMETLSWLQYFFLSCTCLFAAIGQTFSDLLTLSIEKDWVIELAHISQKPLEIWNTTIRQIDLVARLVAPMTFMMLRGLDTNSKVSIEFWIGLITIWHLLLTPLMYTTLLDIYIFFPCLEDKASSKSKEAPKNYFVLWKQYTKHPTFLVSISFCMLYMTVIRDGGPITSVYFSMGGISPTNIGIILGISAAMGFVGTMLFPCLLNYLHSVEKVGTITIWVYFFTLLPSIVFVFSPGSNTGIQILIFSIIASRITLWLTDLAQTQLMQQWVMIDQRGTINALQHTANKICYLVILLFEAIFSDPSQFPLLVGVSLTATLIGAIGFTRWYNQYI